MRITRIGWLGVALIIAGLAIVGGRSVWSKTRTWVPVDIPISLAEGQFRTPDFETNLKAQYIIEIKVQKKIPFDTLNCLLGVERDHSQSEKCTNIPSAVNASWILSSQGTVVARGSTTETTGGDWEVDAIARQIGSFRADKGHRYTLDINVLTDGSSLAVGNPRLKVEVHPSYYEGSAFGDISFVLAAVGLILAGIIMFTASTLRARQ
jgi:hypothetical protein